MSRMILVVMMTTMIAFTNSQYIARNTYIGLYVDHGDIRKASNDLYDASHELPPTYSYAEEARIPTIIQDPIFHTDLARKLENYDNARQNMVDLKARMDQQKSDEESYKLRNKQFGCQEINTPMGVYHPGCQ